MRERVACPLTLLIIGAIIGASWFGWGFLIGSAAAVYASLLFGHLVVEGQVLPKAAPGGG